MFQDVSHALGRFVEVNGNGDGARAIDGKVGSMPLRTVCGEKAEAVARLYTEFHKRRGKTGDAAEKLLGRDGLPTAVAAEHLCTGIRQVVDSVQEARGKGAVVHGQEGHFTLPLLRAQWSLSSREASEQNGRAQKPSRVRRRVRGLCGRAPSPHIFVSADSKGFNFPLSPLE